MKMQEPSQYLDAAGWAALLSSLFWKYMPAPLGALVMVLFDMPKTRKELFLRLVASYIASIFLGDVAFDLLHSFSLLSFLDAGNRKHYAAVEFLIGGCGWSMLAIFATLQRKFRDDPAAAVREAREVIR